MSVRTFAVVSVLCSVLAPLSAVSAHADAASIAAKLADVFSNALSSDKVNNPPPAATVTPDSWWRGYEDGATMWMTLYVRPNQNEHYTDYLGQGFRTGYSARLFTSIPDIRDPEAFQMRPESPWSLRFSGIGKFVLYRNANFVNPWFERVSSSDRPFNYTFDYREVIGSLKFCPGVATYEKYDFAGAPHVYSVCDMAPRKFYCVNVSSDAPFFGSLRFDGLVNMVGVYLQNDCTGATKAVYDWDSKQGKVLALPAESVGKIKSLGLSIKPLQTP